MGKIFEKPIIVVLLLLVLSGYLFFLNLDRMALTDPDETFYAQTAKEMFVKSEWLTPTLYGKPQFEKPILFYWLVELSYAVFGINEFAARFPSALFGFLGLVCIYFLGRILFNNRVGIFSAVMLATCVEYVMLSIGCVTDMVLFVFMLMGVLFFFYGQIRKRDFYYLLSSASFALATLTKGPIGLLLPAFIIILYLVLTKDFALFKKWLLLGGALAVFILIAKPWYMIMYKIHARDFIEVFFGFHNVTRFLIPEHKIGSQIYYNIPIVMGGFFPWSVFFPLGLWYIGRKAFFSAACERNERSHILFLILWFLAIFLFFTASSTKLPTYIFPCFISLAVIVAKLWDDFARKAQEGYVMKSVKVNYYIFVAAIIPALVVLYIFLKIKFPLVARVAPVAGLFLLYGILLSLIAFVNKKFAAALFLIAYSVAVMLYPIGTTILPGLESAETSKAMAQELMKYHKDTEAIGCEHDYCAGMAFYTGKVPVKLQGYTEICDFVNSKERVWYVLKAKNLVDLIADPSLSGKVNIISRSGKKRLVTNKPPERE